MLLQVRYPEAIVRRLIVRAVQLVFRALMVVSVGPAAPASRRF
jgi:hypothetical protein